MKKLVKNIPNAGRIWRSLEKGKGYNKSTTYGEIDRPNLKCFKRGEMRHSASSCLKGRTSGYHKRSERRVDISTVPNGRYVYPMILFHFPSIRELNALCSKKLSQTNLWVRNIISLIVISNDYIWSTLQILSNMNIEQYC